MRWPRINLFQLRTAMIVVVMLACAASVAATASAQTSQTTGGVTKSASSEPAAPVPGAVHTAPANGEAAQLEADTTRLLQLTLELREEVAKSGKDTLSLAAMKKAAEVEKLAKSLKERIKRN